MTYLHQQFLVLLALTAVAVFGQTVVPATEPAPPPGFIIVDNINRVRTRLLGV
jgi:hypothetical protein